MGRYRWRDPVQWHVDCDPGGATVGRVHCAAAANLDVPSALSDQPA
jgi:hypothetical protein